MLVRFTPESLTAAQYDETITKLEAAGDFPPDGLDYHVCFGTDGKLAVSEIWDSQEKFEAFGEKLMPVLSEVGINPGEPQTIEIHNVIKR
jgi:hypothetical protein